MSIDLAKKYTIAEINQVVSKWLLKQENDAEENIFDEIFRDDDDMDPFGVGYFQKKKVKMRIQKKILIV